MGSNSNKSDTNTPISNPFFRHSDRQTHQPVYGVVSGQIPTWLEGTLIRNGPGIFQVGEQEYNHPFDGLAVLHRFHVQHGKATYQNRVLESDSYKKNMKANRIVVSEFGTKGYSDPCHSIFKRLKATFELLTDNNSENMTDNCSVNVIYQGDQLYALTETSFIHRIDPENLKSLGKTNIQDYVALNTATAHPHVLDNGALLNIGNNFRHRGGPHYCIVKIPPSFNNYDESTYRYAKIIAEIPARWRFNPCYYHSFGMTSDKIIFIESPLCISIPKILLSELTMKSFRECMHWYPNEKTRFYIVSMKDGKVHPLIYEAEELFAFHHINAYEENGHVIVDVAGYNSGEAGLTDYFILIHYHLIPDSYFYHKIVNELLSSDMDKPGKWLESATARRYVLPLNVTGNEKIGENLIQRTDAIAKATLSSKSKPGAVIVNCTPRHLTKRWLELPRINYKYNGKPYNFLYGLSAENPGTKCVNETNIISKIDALTGRKLSWNSKNMVASEPIFVSNPTVENPAEDDGVILSSLIHKDDTQAVTLLILNAKCMTEIASVRFQTEGSVPGTLHGMWSQKGERIPVY